MTIKANIDLRRAGIPWNELGKTYRDAVTICRKLGFDYLWIDSLCIVQDDKDDWEREAARMVLVYENAFLVIRAMWSKDGDAGILSERSVQDPPSSFWPLTAPFDTGLTSPDYINTNQNQKVEAPPPVIFARLQPEHHAQEIRRWNPDYEKPVQDRDRDIQFEPLSTRAWAFQEYIVSRRAISYYVTEMSWECAQMRRCECGLAEMTRDKGIQTMANQFRTLVIMAPFYRMAISNYGLGWSEIVRAYSALRLTFESDRLPALSGLASRYGGLCHGKWDGSFVAVHDKDGRYVPKEPQDPAGPDLRLRYLAGLWEFELPLNLLWYRKRSDRGGLEGSGVEDKWRYGGCYRAPTWSWAACTGPVAFKTVPKEEQGQSLAVASVDSVEYSPKGADPYSDCASASISLSGLVVEGRLVWTEDRKPRFRLADGSAWVDVLLDFGTPEQGIQVYGADLDKVSLMELHRSLKNSYGLVLVRREASGKFERIGVFSREEHWDRMRYGSCLASDETQGGRLIGGRVKIALDGSGRAGRLIGVSIFANADRKAVLIT
jgi:hypothetical protein